MTPYFHSKTKLTFLRNFDIRWCRYYVFDSFGGDGEGVEVEGVKDHISEANQYGDNDGERDCASGEGLVLVVLLIA